MIVDLGTGDGRAVLARAVAEPDALVIGIDANAAGMAESSRRAARGRSRLPNAIFLAAAAEALPGLLGGVASVVTVTLPWGSLLRGVLGLDDAVLRGIASLAVPDGRIEVLATVTGPDHLEGVDRLDASHAPAIAAAWRAAGFELVEMRVATPAELLATRSSWARRLRDRTIWRIELAHARNTAARGAAILPNVA